MISRHQGAISGIAAGMRHANSKSACYWQAFSVGCAVKDSVGWKRYLSLRGGGGRGPRHTALLLLGAKTSGSVAKKNPHVRLRACHNGVDVGKHLCAIFCLQCHGLLLSSIDEALGVYACQILQVVLIYSYSELDARDNFLCCRIQISHQCWRRWLLGWKRRVWMRSSSHRTIRI